MSYQAYIDNIQAKTGKTPEDFKAEVQKAGVYDRNMKAGDLINFLKKEHNLGHGHAMAIWKWFVDHDWVDTPSGLKK